MSNKKTVQNNAERFSIRYIITVNDGRRVEDHAQDIAIEQTVEIPADCIPQKVRDAGFIGRIESVTPLADTKNRYDVTISFRCDQTAFSVPQFLNVLYGNISIKNNIKITGLDLPSSLLSALGGPIFGIDGIRKRLGVSGRPLAATALKPAGLSARELAAMAGSYARGGLDIIKEDHNMADTCFCPFNERVAVCQEAVVSANHATGGHTLYFPMVSGGFDVIEEQFSRAKELGIAGVLIAPMLVGPDTMRTLSKRYNLIIMGHPAFTGTHFHSPDHGMTPAVLLGTIFRLIGADISIFPNSGGRFSFSARECTDLANALREPLGKIKPAFPCPAGGMGLDRIESMARAYGPDTMLLIGGGLMQHSPDLEKSSALFMETIRNVKIEK